jgi:hypothetical protein
LTPGYRVYTNAFMKSVYRVYPWFGVVGALALAGCGSGLQDLTRDMVEDLPAGDATGSAASGTYSLQLYTTRCRGTCHVTVDGFSASFCDVGQEDDTMVTVTQTDGALALSSSGLILDRLTGGLFSSGHFVVGSWGTQNGGTVEVEVEAIGDFTGDAYSGEAVSYGHGSVDGHDIDCMAEYEITGLRPHPR